VVVGDTVPLCTVVIQLYHRHLRLKLRAGVSGTLINTYGEDGDKRTGVSNKPHHTRDSTRFHRIAADAHLVELG
jgi:hypothetical protein